MKEISVGKNLVAGVETTIFTVPTGYRAKWNLLYIMNSTLSTKHITVKWTDSSAATDILVLSSTTVLSNDLFKMDANSYIVLEEGDTIKMTSEAGSSFSVICTFEIERMSYGN